ncbi:cupin domain-containing protein [Spirosoma fluminis]
MNTTDNQSIFPRGDKAPAEYFVGMAYVKMLVPQHSAFNSTLANVVFEPGCRNNGSAVRWHSHKGGQLLLCTDGEGYYQERGQPIQLLCKGDVVQVRCYPLARRNA